VSPLTSSQLIALDLDGTLLDGDGRLTSRAIDAVRTVVDAGHRVVLATGRPPDIAVRATQPLAGLASYIVGGNGTIISTFPAHPDEPPELVHVSGFAYSAASDVVTALRRHDSGFAFALATDQGFVHERGFAALMPAAVHDDPVDDVLSIGGTTAFKLLVFHTAHPLAWLLDEVPLLIDHLATGFAVRHMGAEAAEIGPADDDKGSGLRWLCEHLGVNAADVIAVGDEQNDLSMLEWAGRGVAVENAVDRVRAAAGELIGSNLHDGVAHFLEQLVGDAEPPTTRQEGVKTP
jgi:Cof subfamily protein (haloacid dehalogenase superfamily)